MSTAYQYLIHLCLCFAPLLALAEIEPIHSTSELLINQVDDQTLAVFDIDDTLTILHEPAFQRPNFKVHHAEVFANIMSPLSIEEGLLAFTLPLLMSRGDLLEAESPDVIRELQSKGAKTIALTALMGCKIQERFVEDERIDELKRVGIDFSNAFPELQETVYTNFKKPILGSYPLYKKGIIFTNDTDKGAVLVEFLKTLSWTPEQIIFVDDRLEHLHSVEKAIAHYNPSIEFKGFHFRTDPTSYKPVDRERFMEKWIECRDLAKEILSDHSTKRAP